MRVPFVDLGRLHAPLRAELDAAFRRVVDASHFILGPEVEAFERELGAFAKAPFVVGVSSGTDALITALMALDVGPGDEVVTPAFSFIAAAEAIARVGATPVFADVGDDFNLDVASAAERVTKRTRAILFVDLFGRRADVEALAALGVPLVEDAAQAIGAPGVGRGVRAASISFFPTKNLGALGDGGALFTEDAALADTMRLVRAHGSRPKYVHARLGGNMRLDALQAALLRAKLPHLERWNEARRTTALAYRERLASVPGLTLPADAPGHVWHQFVVRVASSRDGAPSQRRDALRAHLAASGVDSEIYYPLALHLQPCFSGLPRARLEGAEAATAEALALPIHAALTVDEIATVAEAVASFSGFTTY
jgi:dTDP-4-amino-4,6-dideoxygalactose transaminase